MLYLKCPGCKKLLGDKQLIYEDIFNKICKDIEMNKITFNEGEKLKSDLLLSFDLKRFCCTPRLMTYKKLIEIVK